MTKNITVKQNKKENIDKKIFISSFENYISVISECSKVLEIEKKKAPEHQKIFLYRGQDNYKYSLIPTLGRPVKSGNLNCFYHRERNLIENIIMIYPESFNISNPLNLLAKMQHYGLPTRLLDVSTNPLVALYFACQDAEDENSEDGAVYIFLPNQIATPFDSVVQAIASSYKLFCGSKISVDDFIERTYKELNLTEKEEKENFSTKFRNMITNQYIFVSATETAQRQKLQQGKYILFTNRIDGNTEYFDDYLEQIQETDSTIQKKLIIPHSLKKEILEKLKTLGISKATLFADSIDIVCSELKKDIGNTLL